MKKKIATIIYQAVMTISRINQLYTNDCVFKVTRKQSQESVYKAIIQMIYHMFGVSIYCFNDVVQRIEKTPARIIIT